MRRMMLATIAVVMLAGEASAQWSTWGQVFPKGAAREPVVVEGSATQCDVKNRWDDGSVRFAVLTTRSPATEVGCPAFYPKLPRIVTRFTIGTVSYEARLPAVESRDLWLSGPHVREARYRVALSTPDGPPHPLLGVVYDVRVFRDGLARVDVTVENIIDQAIGDSVQYDVQVCEEKPLTTNVLYSQAGLTHWYLCRWRKTFALGGLTEPVALPDLEAVYAAKALPRWLTTIQSPARTVTGAAFGPMGGATLNPYMGDVGGRAEIAPYPGWAVEYLVGKRSDQRQFLLAHADSAASWPVHITEPGGVPISIESRPNYWLDARADAGSKPLGNLGHCGPLRPEINHVPSMSYVPYLLTGDRFHADEMKFWANYVLLGTYQNAYQNGRGGSAGLLNSNQVRGMAWGLRNLADAAAYLPDADPLKAYFVAKVANNLKWFDAYAAGCGSPLGISFEDKRPENQTTPAMLWFTQWEANYLAWSIDHTNKQGFPGGLKLRDRSGQYQLSLFTAGAAFDRRYAAAYRSFAGTRAGTVKTFYKTLPELFQANFYNTTSKSIIAPPEFRGNYGADARLMLMLGIENGWPGAQGAYDWLTPQLLAPGFTSGGLSDLASRPGWAIALEGK